MFRRFSRTAPALTLVISLWTVSLAAAAPQSAPSGQTPSPEKPQVKQSASSDKDKKVAEVKPVSGSKLSEKEDPRLIGKRNINSGIIAKMSTSLEKEVAMGRQYAAEVERQVKLIDDPVITEYVNRVGQNVVLHSDAKIPFTIKVVDSDEANAFALPGGFFYVNKGLILAADNEAEVAGVMAHEIAHVAARHTVETMTKANLAQYGMIAGILLGVPPILLDASNLGLGLGFLKFNRGAEEEADRLGVQYLYAAGYDPNGMSTMFEKLAAKNKKKPGFLSKLFATHPQSADRMQASRVLVSRFPDLEEYVISTSEFQRVKARLLRLSNARATTVGDIGGKDDGTPGRPTLKRRKPAPDEPTTTDGQQTPSEEKSNEPPKLKRRPEDTAPPVQPGNTP
ncbi:MAG: M48 family metallopeptidase [Acidobacteriota bacterium]|nr:M48 family metallopeptidase [Acidobacteriota bacterium]